MSLIKVLLKTNKSFSILYNPKFQLNYVSEKVYILYSLTQFET